MEAESALRGDPHAAECRTRAQRCRLRTRRRAFWAVVRCVREGPPGLRFGGVQQAPGRRAPCISVSYADVTAPASSNDSLRGTSYGITGIQAYVLSASVRRVLDTSYCCSDLRGSVVDLRADADLLPRALVAQGVQLCILDKPRRQAAAALSGGDAFPLGLYRRVPPLPTSTSPGQRPFGATANNGRGGAWRWCLLALWSCLRRGTRSRSGTSRSAGGSTPTLRASLTSPTSCLGSTARGPARVTRSWSGRSSMCWSGWRMRGPRWGT
mmetsp:Transcript_35150/g.111755  ORF Transcript_35150/g.111755 Transcript_35150/m.111755 type:complete len:268 (+) Transcript_35150:185-988(+)